MESVKKNQKLIAIGAGVAAGALGLYLLYKKRTSKKIRRFTKKEKDEMVKQIKVIYDGNYLGIDTVVGVLDVLHKIILSESEVGAAENRKLRQENKKDFAKYAEICENYITQRYKMLLSVQKEVTDRLGIPQKYYLESMSFYVNYGHPKVQQLNDKHAEEKYKRKGQMRKVSWEEFTNLMQRFAELWETELMLLPTSKPMVKELINLAKVLEYRVNDVIYEEFGLESEQISDAFATHFERLTGDSAITWYNRYQKARKEIYGVSGLTYFA